MDDTQKPALLIYLWERNLVFRDEIVKGLRELDKYRVVEAHRENEILTRVLGQNFDIVILELTTPGPQGLRTALAVSKTLPRMPIILVSDYHYPLDTLRRMGINAATFVSKPFGMSQMMTALTIAEVYQPPQPKTNQPAAR